MVVLWHNQRSAIDWMKPRQFGLIGHEMGCGKSRTLIESVKDIDLVLIVCPIAVGPAWLKQAGLYDSERTVCLAVNGSSKSRAQQVKSAVQSGGRLIVVLNYDSAWRGDLAKAVAKTAWGAIVLDESHRIKSPSSKVSRWAAKFCETHPTAKRICLTGTPTPQDPRDWYGQFRFLDPSVLGTNFQSFQSRIAVSHPQYKGFILRWLDNGLKAMSERIDEHVHRVTAAEVLDLPEAIHTEISVELSSDTRRFYQDLEREMIARIGEDGVVTAANKMVVVGRLHLAASGYCRADGEEHFRPINGTPEKRAALSEWLKDFPAKEPLVVFCWYHADIEEVSAECQQSGRTFSELSGRRNQLCEWQCGDTEVLIVQQQSGGAGIDLTRACYCVYYSLSHSLGQYEQSLARLRRPGQTRPCRYYHVVATDTVDEDIYSALRDKRDVVESIFSRLTRRSKS